jgi:hypothetical protein
MPAVCGPLNRTFSVKLDPSLNREVVGFHVLWSRLCSQLLRRMRRRLDLDLNPAPALTRDLVALLDLTRELGGEEKTRPTLSCGWTCRRPFPISHS